MKDFPYFSDNWLLTAWLIAFGWLWPNKASFLHSSQLILVELLMFALATTAAVLKCPEEPVISAPHHLRSIISIAPRTHSRDLQCLMPNTQSPPQHGAPNPYLHTAHA
jgi:hypothetical protein